MLSVPTAAESHSADAQKRRSRRQTIGELVYADLGPGNGGFPINITEKGVAFQGILPLEKDQVISIRFKLPDLNGVVETRGQVIWLNELGKGGGLKFIDLPEESCRLINHWISLQTEPGNRNEGVPVRSRHVEKNEFASVPPLSPAALRENALPQNDANQIMPLRSAVLSPVAATQVTVSDKAKARSLTPIDATPAIFREAQNKLTWVMPFTIGMATCIAIVAAMMILLGVISVQVHWPHQMTVESLLRLVHGPGVAKEPESLSGTTSVDNKSEGDGSASDTSTSNAPPIPGTEGPAAEPVVPRLPALRPSPTETPKPPATHSLKISRQQVMTAKLRAPKPMMPARSEDFLPPAFALPPKPELSLQLPMMSSVAPVPALPAGATAQKSSKLDAPQLVARIDPVYPEEAKATSISGSVELRFTISAEGNVRNVSVTKGNYLLARAAVEAVQAWRYHPARLNGIPVEAESSAIFNFRPN